MASDLYTTGLQEQALDALSPAIRAAILQLKQKFPRQEIKALNWDDNYIAIPIDVDVILPSRGTIDDIDIRESEPICLIINKRNYPYQPPYVWSNRKDFPKNRLPHLNYGRADSPASFCLHRGRLDDWYSEHTINELADRARGWLRDAAGGRLIPPGDRFEPIRIDESFGYCLYEPSYFINHIQNKWFMENNREGFAFLWYKLLNSSVPDPDPIVGRSGYAIKIEYLLNEEIIPGAIDLSIRINALQSTDNELGRRLFGILVWPPGDYLNAEYCTDHPHTLEDLIEWSKHLRLPLEQALQAYLAKNLHLLVGVPITLVIPRPQILVDRQTNLELLNFVIIAGDGSAPKDGSWNLNARVSIMSHRFPLTHKRAREISSKPIGFSLGDIIFLGCGSLGSKLILHLARSGQISMTLVDNDTLSPHNLIRNGLLCQALGKNKAKAIKDEIDGIYYADDEKRIEAIEESALNFLLSDRKDMLARHSWLVDTTASNVILDMLCQVELPESIRCCRCEIAHQGQLGLQSIEGYHHNPRVDDLRMQIFDWGIEDDIISDWLRQNQEKRESIIGSGLEEITIGVSCSSESMRLSDEISSLHSASFAICFRKAAEESRSDGTIQLGYINVTEDIINVVRKRNIGKTHVIQAHNNPLWQVRLSNNSMESLRMLYSKSGGCEIGGLLIGIINQKYKIIYVTRIKTISDSMCRPYLFVRGTHNLPEDLKMIEDRTGGLIGYVGEWHTHPMGGSELSDQDMHTVNQIRRYLDHSNLPTHVMIVTLDGLYSHIFHREG
ncbi:MAG: thiamine biosynthesis protein ThiF [Methanosaeta sp. PtaU1.Bin060]|nr:MAG: thiamine biosynthesis protein ThiF [Methanosaeta sp. PtaU1.Bin060]